MDINLIQNICLTAVLIAVVAYLIINAYDADDFGPLTGSIILFSFFGGSIVSIITLLMLIWAN